MISVLYSEVSLKTRIHSLLSLSPQDIPYFPEGVDGTHFSDTAFSCIPVPMPTRNLLFIAGKLTDFDS